MKGIDKALVEEVRERIRSIGEIGRTLEGGASRISYTPLERAAHQLAAKWLRGEGFSVQVDGFGNTIGLISGTEALAPLASGSHLDTVPNGGHYDGVVGVVAALEAIREARRRHTFRHPIAIIIFAGEEAGARFGEGRIGSRGLTGKLPRSLLERLRDKDGVTLSQAMELLGLKPEADEASHWMPKGAAAFVEVHVEAGRHLEQLGVPIALVQGIVGVTRMRVVFQGQRSHAATPISLRRDALAAAADVIVQVESKVRADPEGRALATVGTVWVDPNVVTTVAGRAEIWVDVRSQARDAQAELAEWIRSTVRGVADTRQLAATVEMLADEPPVIMDQRLLEALRVASERRLGWQPPGMSSATTHDTANMAKLGPVAMILVSSKEGIAHDPREFSEPEHIALATNVLSDALIGLDTSV